MKKILIALGVVLTLLIVSLAVFIATFDADRYRPLVVSELQKALGRPVKLERLSLSWQGGFALQANGFALFEDAQASEPLIQVESASASVRLMPLLRKELQVASIVLSRPRIHVSRNAQGQVNLLGLVAATAPAAAPSQTTPSGAAPISFQVGSLMIEEGSKERGG